MAACRRLHQRAGECRRGEQARHEEETAAEEHGREELILQLQPVPDHPDKPQERDTRKGREMDGEPDRVDALRIGQPDARIPLIGRHGEPEDRSG